MVRCTVQLAEGTGMKIPDAATNALTIQGQQQQQAMQQNAQAQGAPPIATQVSCGHSLDRFILPKENRKYMVKLLFLESMSVSNIGHASCFYLIV